MTSATPDRRAIITEALHKIDELSARLEVAEKRDTEPVAVVGVGCCFPGDVVGVWRLLVNGEDAISEVPADRWDADAFYDPDPAAPGRDDQVGWVRLRCGRVRCRLLRHLATGGRGDGPAAADASGGGGGARAPASRRIRWAAAEPA